MDDIIENIYSLKEIERERVIQREETLPLETSKREIARYGLESRTALM